MKDARTLVPEILDSLPSDDPSAQRSRRDLRRINFLMGNFRWLRRSLQDIPKDTPLVEVGSGDGSFLKMLAAAGWENLTAIEIAPRPNDLPDSIDWIREDMVAALPKSKGGVLIANLFWHHFSDEQLSSLAPHITRFRHILLSEPHRSPFASALGLTLVPFINHVTRHDMFVSIRAGFRNGELPGLWKLSLHGIHFRETKGLLGSYRLHTWRE
ncbi:MAG: class I SAM-dependent methyltransferase [Verrucomicrobiae bacterium]|nr:class I SAM-dependent methyltransferase [Verrucomicrobiae bacterium]